jgi:hypothetical protein
MKCNGVVICTPAVGEEAGAHLCRRFRFLHRLGEGETNQRRDASPAPTQFFHNLMGVLGLSKGPQCSKIRVCLFCLHHPVLCTSNFLIVAKMYTVHLIFPTRCTTSSSCSAPLPPPLSQPPSNLRLPPPLPQPPYRPAPIGHRSLRLLLPRRDLDLGGASAGSWLPLPESARVLATLAGICAGSWLPSSGGRSFSCTTTSGA